MDKATTVNKMSSDTVPIMQASAPPSYVESQRQHDGATTSPATTTQPTSTTGGAPPYPPPYGPPTPTYILESRGENYQRFGMIDGPVTLVALNGLNKDPCQVVCPACGKQVLTVTRPAPGALTCLVAALCLFVFFPCVVLPFCIEELQDVTHSCPVCKCYIATYTRI